MTTQSQLVGYVRKSKGGGALRLSIERSHQPVPARRRRVNFHSLFFFFCNLVHTQGKWFY
jgi:hypothetical protein